MLKVIWSLFCSLALNLAFLAFLLFIFKIFFCLFICGSFLLHSSLRILSLSKDHFAFQQSGCQNGIVRVRVCVCVSVASSVCNFILSISLTKIENVT